MKATSYDMPFRPNFEAKSAAGWLIGLLVMLIAGLLMRLPVAYVIAISLITVAALAFRAFQAFKLWDFFLALGGQPFTKITFQEMQRKAASCKGELWLGTGFNWTPRHAELANEVLQRDFRQVQPPQWVARLLGKASASREFVGMPWIHGLGRGSETDITIPLKFMEGNTTLVGAPGSGKTTLYRLKVFQAALRGDTVIVIDPKNDRDLKNALQEAAIRAGAGDRFIAFDPAHPTTSIRYDPMANWSRDTEAAKRVTDVVVTFSGGADNFTSYTWSVLQTFTDALLYVGRRPSLRMFRALVETGPESLMEEVFIKFFQEKYGAEFMQHIEADIRVASSSKKRDASTLSPRLGGMMAHYKSLPFDQRTTQAVNGLLETVEHNREHLGKMLTSLKPALIALTAGDLGDLLSPNQSDLNDTRPIFDSGKITKGKYIAYIGLDSMTDSVTASAISTLILADISAVAGSRYNYADRSELAERTELIIDETGEIISLPLVTLLNKARGSGLRIIVAMQSFADITTKLGSTAFMEQVLDNTQNLIALRTKGDTTTKQIVRMIGKTKTNKISKSLSAGSRSDDAGLHITGSEGTSVSKEDVALFPEELIARLPNFEYIGYFAGGNVIKGKFPILT